MSKSNKISGKHRGSGVISAARKAKQTAYKVEGRREKNRDRRARRIIRGFQKEA